MTFVRKKNGLYILQLEKIIWLLFLNDFLILFEKIKEMFQGDSHQDTQEFLIWLLNMIDETLQKAGKKKKGFVFYIK